MSNSLLNTHTHTHTGKYIGEKYIGGKAPVLTLQVPPRPTLPSIFASYIRFKSIAQTEQEVRSVPSKVMKDYLLQAPETRWIGPTFESLPVSDGT